MMNPVAGEVPASSALGKDLEGELLLATLRRHWTPVSKGGCTEPRVTEMFSTPLGNNPEHTHVKGPGQQKVAAAH